MSRRTIKLAISGSHAVDGDMLVDAALRWAARESGTPVHRVHQQEHDDYFRTRDPGIVLKSRQVEGEKKPESARRWVNRRTGENHAGDDGSLILMREEKTKGDPRDILLLPYLSPEHAQRLGALLAQGLAYDLSVDKTRTQLVTEKGWYVNIDHLPWLRGQGSHGGHFIEIQCDEMLNARDLKHLEQSLTAALTAENPDWQVTPEPRHYRELKEAHLAADPLRIARENSWLHAMSMEDVRRLATTPPIGGRKAVLSEGIDRTKGAFIVNSGTFDVFVHNHKVKELKPGEVFGDVGPMAEAFGFVRPLPQGDTLRFGTVRPREGTQATLIPISRALLDEMCHSGALNGFRSIIRRNVSEWKQPEHDSYLSL